MITINYERVKLEEICVSNMALQVMLKEVLAKVNDIVVKLTNNKCYIDQLACTSSIGRMQDPFLVIVKHTATDVIVKVYENKLVTTV